MNKFNEMLRRYELPIATFGLEDDLPPQDEVVRHESPGHRLPTITGVNCSAQEEPAGRNADEFGPHDVCF